MWRGFHPSLHSLHLKHKLLSFPQYCNVIVFPMDPLPRINYITEYQMKERSGLSRTLSRTSLCIFSFVLLLNRSGWNLSFFRRETSKGGSRWSQPDEIQTLSSQVSNFNLIKHHVYIFCTICLYIIFTEDGKLSSVS